MSSQSRGPARRPVASALCLFAASFAVAIICAATAKAALYDVVFCAAGNDSGNPVAGAGPGFDWITDCGAPGSYPADGGHFLRLNENTGGASANNNEVSLSWYAPSGTSIVAGGGYTRQPNAFNPGWRARFWGEDWGGGVHNILLQGAGIQNGDGITKNTTSIFASHLWPFGGYDDYKRFVFGLWCVRAAGCDRSNFNAVDANTITLVADDRRSPQASFVDTAIVGGDWVRGERPVSWRESDEGSGLRFSRLGADGATLGDGVIDYQANGGCRIGHRDGGREFGKSLVPCTRGPYQRWYGLNTEDLSDGVHTLSICLQDYGQSLHDSESCDRRTVRTDNSAPGKPAALEVTSANPDRYLPRFGARFSLPPDKGSPIAKVHYYITDDQRDDKIVVPERAVAATNPTTLSQIEGVADPGSYTLHVALEDQVGFVGPFTTAPIPHDTTPPAAPQELRVLGTTAHRVPEFDVRWNKLADKGSPVDTARYDVLDGRGDVIAPAQTVTGEDVREVRRIQTPARRGEMRVRVWMIDAEGNVGAAATVGVPRDAKPPAAPQDLSVTAPISSRAEQGFDLRWRNIGDDGSAITAAHYRIRGAEGIVVATTTVAARNIERIKQIETPRARGAYTLELWLSDAEGNIGAPVKAPLAYSCTRADGSSVSTISMGLGRRAAPRARLRQGRGVSLRGKLDGGSVGDVPVCVFGRIVTESERQFLGVALSGADGRYLFPVPAGPSRELTAVQRSGQREVAAQAIALTRVRPRFRLVRKVVRNKGFAVFRTTVPGPGRKNVVVVLQVKSGKAWRVFRRCRTNARGRCLLRYRFTQTPSPTVYIMRAQVRRQSGYAYEEGNSKARRLRVVPASSRALRAR